MSQTSPLQSSLSPLSSSITSPHSMSPTVQLLPHPGALGTPPIAPPKLTVRLILHCAMLTLSSLQYGYVIGHLNSPKFVMGTECKVDSDPFRNGDCFPMSELDYSIAVSILTLGGAIGSAMAGWAADSFGRRKVLMAASWVWTLTGILISAANGVSVLIVARFLAGLASGWTIVVVPMYLTEISPLPWRGLLGILSQLGIVIGIFLAQLAGFALSTFTAWRSIFHVSTGMGLLQFGLLWACFESPRFEAAKEGGWDAARRHLQMLRGLTRVEDEMATWRQEDEFSIDSEDMGTEEEDPSPPMVSFEHVKKINSTWKLLRDPSFRRQVRLCLFLQWLQQCSGINAVMYYSTDIFTKVYHGDEEAAKAMTLAISGLNMVMTLVAVYSVEKCGRRALLLMSLVGMEVGALFLTTGISWISSPSFALLGVCLFVASFAIGLGPIPFVMVGEVFPFEVLGKATSMSLLMNWVWNGVVAFFFPSLNDWMNGYVFLVFAIIILTGLSFSYFNVPETKGKPVDQVAHSLYR